MEFYVFYVLHQLLLLNELVINKKHPNPGFSYQRPVQIH
jgi:hypothetical protein